jgi:hypothetical protein
MWAYSHICKSWPMPFFTLAKWFGNITKPKIMTFESKKLKTKQNKIKNLVTCDNGHMWHF